MSTLNGKIAIVTGANSGMGMASTAIYLATSKEVCDITGEYFYKCKSFMRVIIDMQ